MLTSNSFRSSRERQHEIIMTYVIEYLAPESLKPYPGNARTHSKRQIGQIARSIERFGFNNPVLIDATDTVVNRRRGHIAGSIGSYALKVIKKASSGWGHDRRRL